MINFLLLLTLLYPYRELTHPPIPTKKEMRILVLCPPRSGSTLLYNVAQYLFEDKKIGIHYNEHSKVIKLHNLKGLPPLENIHFIIFTTIRNPIQIIQSLLRVGINPNHYDLDPIASLWFPAKTLTFRYEKMIHDNFDYIFQKIEKELLISIPKQEKRNIKNYFNKNAMKKIQKKYKSFTQYDPITGIHGKHISDNIYTKEIPEKWYDRIFFLSEKWGYEKKI